MAPTLICLLGAIWPSTLAGTIAGNPAAAAAPSKNLRRDTSPSCFIVMSPPYYPFIFTFVAFIYVVTTSSMANNTFL
jgi:hypothetical protein